MESLSSLTFKASVPEAIFEAKAQKKLFVVYISGEDEESDKLNKLTWTDAPVCNLSLSYQLLAHPSRTIHLPTSVMQVLFLRQRFEKKKDPLHQLLDPYSSVPCIAAIGFSGTQVWKNEGFIAGEDLASSLEKAWVGLHIQETNASILSAALASQNSEQPASVVLPSECGSLDAAVSSPSMGTSGQSTERKSMTKENNDDTAAVKGKDSAEPSNLCDTPNYQPASSVEGRTKGDVEHEETGAHYHVQAEKEPIRPTAPRPNDKTSSIRSSTDRKRKQGTVINEADSGSGVGGRDISLAKSVGTKEAIKAKDEGEKEDGESPKKSPDVRLNIRLPDGASLQEKFHVTSLLRMVKDYVNSNQTTGLGAYDLAVPYPRKVYSDQDLDKSLSELGLFDRQALVVVPRKKATVYLRGPSYSESNNNTDTENLNNGGYFGYVRRLLSYANPFSYFGNATSSAPEPRSGVWEYRPNPELRNNLAQADSSSRDPSEGRGIVRNRRPTTASRIGSNIHTLKHDEEDAPFGDENTFWNGNSTQFGGGDSNDRR